MNEMFEPVTPRRVLYCYGVYQSEFQDMESRFPFVTFQKGLPSDSDIESLIGDHNLIVIDDLMNELINNKDMKKTVYTGGAS